LPAADLRDVLLVQDLAHTHEHVNKFHLTDARVSSYDRKGGAPDAEVQRSSNDAGGDTLVGGGHLADDAIEDVLVHDDLELLRRVIRPHGQNVQITLNFHHVVEDEREVLPVADIQ